MRVQPKAPTYEVFHLESKSQLTELRDWLGERGWLMQIQRWEEIGYFRPEIYINTNFFDVYFRIGLYLLMSTVENEWHHRPIRTFTSLQEFEIVED